jgi:hypothetical protein
VHLYMYSFSYNSQINCFWIRVGMDIWSCIFVCGNRARSLSATFKVLSLSLSSFLIILFYSTQVTCTVQTVKNAAGCRTFEAHAVVEITALSTYTSENLSIPYSGQQVIVAIVIIMVTSVPILAIISMITALQYNFPIHHS